MPNRSPRDDRRRGHALAASGALVVTALAACAGGRCGSRGTIVGAPAALPTPPASRPAPAATLVFHPVKLDASGALAAWPDVAAPYDRVMRLAWTALEHVPVQSNGKPTFYAHSMFDGTPEHLFVGGGWANNPAGLAAMIGDSALGWYAYSGDEAARTLAVDFALHVIAHGRSRAEDAWARVPFASSPPYVLAYGGADDRAFCADAEPCGRGDGVGFLEPDKVGEFAITSLLLFESTGTAALRDAAIDAADALAKHVRVGDGARSPWPFRIDAATGTNVRDEFCAHALAPIRLFDELIRLGLGDVASYQRARTWAWNWLLAQPLTTQTWQAYFEDIPSKPVGESLNQYVALETTRYVLAHPDLDPQWKSHATATLEWVSRMFGKDVEVDGVLERGLQFGAEAIGEQTEDPVKMASHTARFAATLALWSERTGDLAARARAERSFNWATYSCSDDGVVKVGPNDREGFWFSDGYGDYMRHFLRGMASVPEWAPRDGAHVLRSTSTVKRVDYAADVVTIETFDPRGEVRLVVPRPVMNVEISGKPVARGGGDDSFVATPLQTGGFVIDVRHASGRAIRVSFQR